MFRGLRRGQFDEAALERHLNSRGLMNRFLGRVTRSISRSWQLYPLGVLFGLGFDTATEIALLVLAGSSTAAGLPWYAILCLPVIFAAGMTLLDTIDGSAMSLAYGWAFSQPVRKVYYNIIITGLSVATALFIGGLEISQVISNQLNLTGGYWDAANSLELNTAGYYIVAGFVIVWAIALIYWRVGKVEQRWHDKAHAAQLKRGENTDHAAAGLTPGKITDGFKID